ncbi:MAG TPA: glycosyltransferase family 39 protein [Elusimicrobiota bacterium]|nr:glycosyltransferase family 39 protein [Elusimicrobiota bacterium]
MDTDRKAIAGLAILVLLTTLPFVRRAYFVDDYYHMLMAKGLLEHPARPYDFRSDDAGFNKLGWERGERPRMVNPPLFHFCMAAVIALAGDAVWKLRSASLVFSLIAIICSYFLGKRFTRRPGLAAALIALTPAYWLTSYSLLIDSGLIAFFMAALLCFVVATERRSATLSLLGGLLMGLAILTKYFGVLVVPVALAWQLMDPQRRRWRPGYLGYGVCAALQILWGVWNIATYGQMHFWSTLPRGFHSSSFLGVAALLVLAAALISRGRWMFGGRSISAGPALALAFVALCVAGLFRSTTIAGWLQSSYLDKILVVGTFLSGCTGFLLLAPIYLARRDLRSVLFITGLSALLYVGFHSRGGGFRGMESVEMAVLIGCSISFLVLIWMDLQNRSDTIDRFLITWLALGLLELVGVMPWTAGRYFLTILPPLVWLFVRWAEKAGNWSALPAAVCCAGILGGNLAYADYAQANTIVTLAQFLSTTAPQFQTLAPKPAHHWYYQADTFDGSQPYILPLGWENVLPDQSFQPGDLLLRSRYRKSGWWTVRDRGKLMPVLSYDVPSQSPFRVMDVPDSAGFYASCWGALPFAITGHPLETFDLYQRR